MSGYTRELEREIAAQGGRRRSTVTQSNAKPATPVNRHNRAGNNAAGRAARVPGTRGDAIRSAQKSAGQARRSRRSLTFGAVDYRVPEPVTALAQPKSMACWATALTVLYSWRDRQSRSIEDVTSEVGTRYRELFDNNTGLSATDKDTLMQDAGLGSLSATNLGADGWQDLLQQQGPVWVTTQEGASIHGRIVHGIHGDGSATGTTLDIIDPAGGRQYAESVSTFLPKFEAEALAGSTDRVNIVYLASGRPASMSLRQKALVSRRRQRSRQFSAAATAVNVTVPGIVPLIAQPTNMTCWAASYSMLENWSENRSVGIEVALGNLGATWLSKFRNNQGLSGPEISRFIAAAGLHAEPAASYTVEAWAGMLQDFGPLLIVTDEAPGTAWAVHARVIYGIHGDGTAEGTRLKIHNPAPVGRGVSLEETVATFLPKYEQMAEAAGFMGLQIIHFLPDAQLQVSRSLRHQASVRGGHIGSRAMSTLPSATVLAERVGGNLPQRVTELLASGVTEADVQAFLMQLQLPQPASPDASYAQGRYRARAFQVAQGTTLTLPTGTVLEGWKAQIFLNAALSVMTAANPLAPLVFRQFQSLTDTLDVTLGMGVAGSLGAAAGDGAGLGLGAGVLIAPGKRVGFYGSIEHSLAGFAMGGAITLQVTVVKGGPSNFSGRAVAIGGVIGEGLIGGARALLSAPGPDQHLIGFMAEFGLGAGLSPVELTTSIQDTVSSLGLPAFANGLSANTIPGEVTSDPAIARATRLGDTVVSSVERLLSEGINSKEILAFLDELSPDTASASLGYVVPFGGDAADEERFEVHLPGSKVLSGWQAELFLGALAAWLALPSMGTGFPAIYLLMHGIRKLCNTAGVTIAIGPAVSGGIAQGGSLGAGLVFAPGDRIGFYGSAALLNGALASIEATAQVTLLHGGPELLDGTAIAVGGSISAPGGVSPVGGFYVLLDDGQYVGLMVEIGASVGLSVFETLASFQYTVQSVDARGYSGARGYTGTQSYSGAKSLSGLWSRSASGRRSLSRAQSTHSLHAQSLNLPDLSAWQHLIQFQPSSTVAGKLYDKMGAITPSFTLWDGWPIQQLDRASGPINLDYYPVKINALPGVKTPPQLIEAMRLNLNSLVDNRYANFEPYDDDEKSLWLGANPESAVIHIDMRMGSPSANPDDGSVACTKKTSDHWIFSTIWSIDDLAHPVSGNRQFGFINNTDGTITLYTRGADRPSRLVDNLVSDSVFSGAHSLWMSLQQGIKRWVDDAGGSAEILTPVSERHDWDDVKSRYG